MPLETQPADLTLAKRGEWLYALGHVDVEHGFIGKDSICDQRFAPNCTYSACLSKLFDDSSGDGEVLPTISPGMRRSLGALSRKPSRTHTASSHFPLNDALGVTKSRRHVSQSL